MKGSWSDGRPFRAHLRYLDAFHSRGALCLDMGCINSWRTAQSQRRNGQAGATILVEGAIILRRQAPDKLKFRNAVLGSFKFGVPIEHGLTSITSTDAAAQVFACAPPAGSSSVSVETAAISCRGVIGGDSSTGPPFDSLSFSSAACSGESNLPISS